MFSNSESNWMESLCKGVCLLEYQSNTNVFQCCADIVYLNIFLDRLEMQEFVRSSVHHIIFIVAMIHEWYYNVFLMKDYVEDFYWKSFTWSKVLVVRNKTKNKTNKKVRRELYAQCFDELIRQTTVSGLILIDCLTFHKICFQFLQENLISSKIKGFILAKLILTE